MGKLLNELHKQLLIPKYKKDAENCLKLYKWLQRIDNGCVWSSKWGSLTTCIGSEGIYPNAFMVYVPSPIGQAVLKQLKKEERSYVFSWIFLKLRKILYK